MRRPLARASAPTLAEELTRSRLGAEPGWIASDDTQIISTPMNLGFMCAVFDVDRLQGQPVKICRSTASTGTKPTRSASGMVDFSPRRRSGNRASGRSRIAGTGADTSGVRSSRAPDDRQAIYGCDYPSVLAFTCTGVANLAPVGTANLGAGLWGQLDLAGGVWEWNLDSFTVAYVEHLQRLLESEGGASSSHVVRGGDFEDAVADLLVSRRYDDASSEPGIWHRARCARAPWTSSRHHFATAFALRGALGRTGPFSASSGAQRARVRRRMTCPDLASAIEALSSACRAALSSRRDICAPREDLIERDPARPPLPRGHPWARRARAVPFLTRA